MGVADPLEELVVSRCDGSGSGGFLELLRPVPRVVEVVGLRGSLVEGS